MALGKHTLVLLFCSFFVDAAITNKNLRKEQPNGISSKLMERLPPNADESSHEVKMILYRKLSSMSIATTPSAAPIYITPPSPTLAPATIQVTPALPPVITPIYTTPPIYVAPPAPTLSPITIQVTPFKPPTSKAKSPSSKAKSPSSKAKSPSSKAKSPSSKAKSPSSKAKSPSSKAKSPSSKAKKPVNKVSSFITGGSVSINYGYGSTSTSVGYTYTSTTGSAVNDVPQQGVSPSGGGGGSFTYSTTATTSGPSGMESQPEETVTMLPAYTVPVGMFGGV